MFRDSLRSTQPRLRKNSRQKHTSRDPSFPRCPLNLIFLFVHPDPETLLVTAEAQIGGNEELYVCVGDCVDEGLLEGDVFSANEGSSVSGYGLVVHCCLLFRVQIIVLLFLSA